MADIAGYLKDMSGNPLGVTGNPVYITFATSAPSTYHIEPVIKYVYLENLNRLRTPRSRLERIWQNIGIYMKWV